MKFKIFVLSVHVYLLWNKVSMHSWDNSRSWNKKKIKKLLYKKILTKQETLYSSSLLSSLIQFKYYCPSNQIHSLKITFRNHSFHAHNSRPINFCPNWTWENIILAHTRWFLLTVTFRDESVIISSVRLIHEAKLIHRSRSNDISRAKKGEENGCHSLFHFYYSFLFPRKFTSFFFPRIYN